MREIVLDTETTGFEPYSGHRMVEIGCVELINHVPTGNYYHQYLNPEREVPEEAFRVHGLNLDFLKDKPIFRDVADEFLDFLKDSNLIIHNAEFDMKFINAELSWINKTILPMTRAVDTLRIARSKFPGMSVSLDALCKRYSIDNSKRDKHGALLDSELLAEVYLELIGGREPGFVLSKVEGKNYATSANGSKKEKKVYEPRRLSIVSPEEELSHQEFLKKISSPLWNKA
ncbi:MAG: DNA polymerase III subunit epsilon [Alphaproteobacteria bacterium]